MSFCSDLRISAVVPVVNEGKSLDALFQRLLPVVEQCKNFKVLIVDGASEDNTAAVVEEWHSQYSWISLLREPRRSGLGAAYAAGMRYVMAEQNPDFILEMDGDLQHRPEDLSRFIQAAEAGYDYVIGSRLVSGGSIPTSWGIERRFLSGFGNVLCRLVLQVPGVCDYTSGFKLSRVKGFLDGFDFEALYSKRHAYKVHLLYFMYKKGARIQEVPIVFDERKTGHSKLLSHDIFDMLRVLVWLRVFGA